MAQAKRKSGTGRRSQKTKAAIAREQERRRQKRQTAAIFMFAFSVLYFILSVAPDISPGIGNVIYGLFGVASVCWGAIFFYVSILTALDKPESRIGAKCCVAAFFGLLISSFVYCFSPVSKELMGLNVHDTLEALYEYGSLREGTGMLGGWLGALMVGYLGKVFSIIVLLLSVFVVTMLMTQTGLIQLFRAVSTPVKKASKRAGVIAAERAAYRAERDEARRLEQEARERERIKQERERERYRREHPEEFEELPDESPDPQPSLLSRLRSKLSDFDIPLDNEDEYEDNAPQREQQRKSAKTPEADVLDDLKTSSTAKPARKPAKDKPQKSTAAELSPTLTPIPDFISDPDAEVTDSDFEELLAKVAGKTKRQREQEITMEATQFAREVVEQETQPSEYFFPSTNMLIPCEDEDGNDIRPELRQTAELLVEVLAQYNVSASVVDICRGPSVTRYELQPAPGVKIAKITSLTNDIALRLSAMAIRIEAPIPGKPVVGIEIPNKVASTVHIRELLESSTFRDAKSPVTVAIGQDIDGNNIYADISKMPHLLISGSTGMGKSVCINSFIMSLLFKASPQEVRLIMVDPKSVELDIYNGIPHLLVPVVCDPKKAAGALQWAVGEMDKRYRLLKENSVRNIDGYNKLADETEGMERMPRVLIIIDEMADLMATSPKEVENAIARLAAMARAAGMHMILATQRPSVDVITGTIKNNIPSRIAFRVSQQVDSRTILDEGGAEGLIGNGDMLFKPVGKKPTRIQGCYVADEEVNDIVRYIKSKCTAEYDEEIAREIERNASDSVDSESAGEVTAEDPMFMKAVEVVVEAGQASTSMLQRRIGVGYARAGRIIDQLFEKGIIGPFEGSKPRQVLISRQQFLELAMAREDAHRERSAEATAPLLPSTPPAAAKTAIADQPEPAYELDEDGELYDGIDDEAADNESKTVSESAPLEDKPVRPPHRASARELLQDLLEDDDDEDGGEFSDPPFDM